MHDYLAALIGGGMIGLAAMLMMLSVGRVMGISGIVSGLLPPKPETRGNAWRVAFIAGVLLAPLLFIAMFRAPPEIEMTTGPIALVTAGLIVGFGTIVGNGCTSGHGVCGLARLSKRSFVATPVFMITAIGTVFIMRHGLGG